MSTWVSWLTPKAEPRRVATPITRKRTPAMVTGRPTGSSAGNRASATSRADVDGPRVGLDVRAGQVGALGDRPVEHLGHGLGDALDGREERERAGPDVLA